MKKYGFVFLSAILITLSLYPFNLSFLAFVFFIPAFYGITLSKSLKERIFLSITFGFSVFLLNFFWAIKTMEFYGKLPSWLSYLLGIPLSIYQTLPFILLLLSFPYLIKKKHYSACIVVSYPYKPIASYFSLFNLFNTFRNACFM